MAADDDVIEFDPDDLSEPLCTVAREQRGHGRFIRQRGGVEKYGDVILQIAPNTGIRRFRLVWEASEFLPKPFMRDACFDGIREALARPLNDGRRLAFVQVTVVDGSYHDVDTDAISMKIAAAMAVQDAISRAHLIPA